MTPREVFEKTRCKKQCSDHCMYDGLCKEYVDFLEEQNALMLEALKKVVKLARETLDYVKDKHGIVSQQAEDHQKYLCNIIKQVSGELEG